MEKKIHLSKTGKVFIISESNLVFQWPQMYCKSQLHSDLMDYIDTIEHLPLHSRFKIVIITRYVYSKLRWSLIVNEIDSTWIKTNLDSLVLRFVRKWLQLHPAANTDHLKLPPKKFGLGLFPVI